VNVPFFIAKKVISNPSHSFSKLIIRIAILAVALGMTVMIVASSLISGFKHEITGKIFGFWGHIHIMDFEATSTNAYESIPIPTDQDFYPSITEVENFQYIHEVPSITIKGHKLGAWLQTKTTNGGVRHIQTFAQKIGVIKTKDEIEGIVLKGVGKDYDWKNMEKFLDSGDKLDLTAEKPAKEIIISKQTAKRLGLGLGDKLLVYFVKGESKIKKRFTVKGIYKTGLEEYDTKFAIIDIREIQKINGWAEDEVSGFELFIDDLDDMEPISDAIYDELPMNLYSSSIKNIDPNIFGWLELQDINEKVILILMLIVGMINMITALIILILERTNMIGTLKALGASNSMIQKIFLYYGSYITILGLLLGNIVGVSLCLIQKYFGIITLPEEDYYVSVAPIDLSFSYILFLNAGTLALTVMILVIPSLLVRSISPIKAIRFK
jgi:lipoprotein-releasing system permease protein